MKLALAILVAVAASWLALRDSVAEGRALLAEGRHADALAWFRDADRGASGTIAYDRALAALLAGELDEAGAAAEQAAAFDADLAPLTSFLRGNVEMARFATAEIETFRPGVDLSVYDRAVARAELARRHFVDAAVTRDDWPEARRNAERAVLAAARLAARREEAAQRDERTRREKAPKEKPAKPVAPPTPKPQTDAASKVVESELSAADVLRVLETLAQKETEKVELRRTRRGPAQGGGDRDW